jgi:hypothetical protein
MGRSSLAASVPKYGDLMPVFYCLRYTPVPRHKSNVQLLCKPIDDLSMVDNTIARYRVANPNRKYCAVAYKCAVKVLGKQGIPDQWGEADWPLPFPGEQ